VRLFVAIDAPPALRAWMGEARAAVARWDRHAAGGLRWVDPGQAHLTVRFLGEVGDQQARALPEALRAPLRAPMFGLQLSAVSWLPPRGRPRVLVAALARGTPEFAAVRRELDARLDALVGPDPESRPLRPHLTLSRVRDRDAGPGPARAAEVPAACGPVPGAVFVVDRVRLYRSATGPQGPRYEVMAEALLAASAGEAP
jgi:2'-5' RNA ligase